MSKKNELEIAQKQKNKNKIKIPYYSPNGC